MRLSKYLPGFLKRRLEMRKKTHKARRLFAHLGNSVIKSFLRNYDYALPLSLLEKIDLINKKARPKLIVEFGSGVSTLMWSKNLSAYSTLVTVEEDIDFLKQTKELVEGTAARQKILFIYSPKLPGLENYETLLNCWDFKSPAGAMLIDGPKGDRFTEKAVKLYEKMLDAGSFCLIDDTDREITNQQAKILAEKKRLLKYDFQDEIRPNHRYSVLAPASVNIKEFFELKT